MYYRSYGPDFSGGIRGGFRDSFRNGSALTRLIYINCGMFLGITLLYIPFLLMGYKGIYYDMLLEWLGVPADPGYLLYRPWTVVTYMFTHFGFLHLLFNMLWLYWFGKFFLGYFRERQLVGVYLLGGIAGAALFILCYNIFPYYADSAPYSFLLGASASVMAIVFGVSFYAREEEVMLFLIGRIKIYYLAILTLLLDLLSITSGNAGGHLAHIGGALFGILFASRMRAGKDITRPLNRLLDKLANLFSRKPRMKVTYKRPETDYEYNARKQREAADLDAILDKLKRSGYQSLTSDEKKQLFDASKK